MESQTEKSEDVEVTAEYSDVKPSGEDSGREILVEEVLEKFDSFLLRKPFICLVGGLAIHGKTKGDIDILVKAGEDELPESFTIPLEFRILRMFNPEDRERVHIFFDKYEGPITDHYELADLKIESRGKFDKVEMSKDLDKLETSELETSESEISKQRTNPGQKQTYNSPTFAYFAVYQKLPEEFLSGRSEHPQRTWQGIPVDEALKDSWLDALKAIEEIEVRASCCGHGPDRVSYIVFRLKSGCDVDSKKVSEKLNAIPSCYSIADIGDQGKMRIVVAGKVWHDGENGTDGWSEWWEKLAGKIKEVVEEVVNSEGGGREASNSKAEKSQEPEKVEKEFDAKSLDIWDEIEHAISEEELPEVFVEKAKFHLEVRKAEFQLVGEAGIEANREARASMKEDRVRMFRRLYPQKTSVSAISSYRTHETYSNQATLGYLQKLYEHGVR